MTLIRRRNRMPFPPAARKSISVSRKPSSKKIDAFSSTFPVELRVEILRLVLAHFSVDKRAPDAAPFKLMRVSRVWRQLVLNTPQLWSSFALQVSTPPTNGQQLVDALGTCLTRSKGMPLSFKLCYPVLDATCTALFQRVFAAPVRARWRDITLHAPSASLLSLWESPSSDMSPNLRSLAVETVGLAPFRMRNLGLNWTKLVDLDLFLITMPSLDECLYTLQQGGNLASCKLNAVCVLDRTVDRERVVLPKLRELKLKLYDGLDDAEEALNAFLACIECPKLRSFGLQWNVSQDWSQPGSLVTFLNRVSNHLERMHLAYIPFSSSQLVHTLSAVPKLRDLRISVSNVDNIIDGAFLNALEQDKGLLPLLEALEVDCSGESFTDYALLRLMGTRWRYPPSSKRGGCLEYLAINGPKRVAEYTPRWFRDWHDAKLDVRASLRDADDLLVVVRAYLGRGRDAACFLNSDFSQDIRSLLVFDISPK